MKTIQKSQGQNKSPKTQCITCSEAGKIGGMATLARHGMEHFQIAGAKGQAALVKQHGSADRKKWGSMGGRPRKVQIQLEGAD